METLTTSVVIQIFNAFTGIVLAHSLYPTERGILAAAILWPGLLSSLVAFGVADAIAYRSSRYSEERGHLLGTGLVLAAVSTGLSVPIGLALLPRLLSHYGSDAVISAELFLLYIPIYLTWQNLAAVLLGALRTAEFNAARIMQVALSAIGIALLAIAHGGSTRAFILVYLVANTGTLAYVAWRAIQLRAASWQPSIRISRAVLSYGIRSHLGTVSGITNDYLDQGVISIFLPAAQLAYYAIAVSISAPLALVGSSLGMMVMPSVASQPDPEARTANLARYARVTLAMEAGLGIVLMAIVPLLIAVLFGLAYEPASPSARILVIATVFLGANRVLSAGVRALNRPLTAGSADLLASVVTVAGLIILIPAFGIVGAAITSLIAYAVTTMFLSLALNRLLAVPLATLLIVRPSDFRTIVIRMLDRQTTGT